MPATPHNGYDTITVTFRVPRAQQINEAQLKNALTHIPHVPGSMKVKREL